jgi:hypothetical protein
MARLYEPTFLDRVNVLFANLYVRGPALTMTPAFSLLTTHITQLVSHGCGGAEKWDWQVPGISRF